MPRPPSALHGKFVAVTGAAGTLGSAVVERFRRANANVRGLVRGNAPTNEDTVVGSLDDSRALAALTQGAAVVVHCAAALNDHPVDCRRTNVDGTRAIAEAALAAGAKFVHLSTVSVYAHRRSRTLAEDAPRLDGAPEDYGSSKAEGERIVERLGSRGLRYVILRPVAVLSMHPRSYWGTLALARAKDDPDPLVPVAEFPYVHVENLAEAVFLAATNEAALGRIYNVVDGHGPTNKYLEAVATAIGRAPRRVPPGAPSIRYSGDRIRAELGYAPVDRFEEFLAQLSNA